MRIGQNSLFLSSLNEIDIISESDKENIILIGMGASISNTKALASFLKTRKKIIYIDSLEQEIIDEKLENMTPINSEVIAISKSGTTDEAIKILKYILEEKLKNPVCYVVSENPESELVKIAKLSANYHYIKYETSISGRFAILKNASFIPLIFAGSDIKKLPQISIDEESYMTLAENLIENYRQNRKIIIISIYNQKYLGFAQWLCQIISESLGKNGYGITPIISQGSSDEHSQLQLYLDGGDDKLFYILAYNSETNSDLSKAQKNHYEAFLKALEKADRPTIIEESIGFELILKWMLATEYIAKSQNINPFDQPAVDEAKKLFL
jgi:glucose-6-phosphate isomerase